MKKANCVRKASVILRPKTSITAGISGSIRFVMNPQAKNSSVTEMKAISDPRFVVMNSPPGRSGLTLWKANVPRPS